MIMNGIRIWKAMFEERPDNPEFAWGEENTVALVRNEFLSNTFL
jgi:hypothetical protein